VQPSNAPSTTPAHVRSLSTTLPQTPGRGEGLQIRVSAPETGDTLPVIVFSHGFGSSMDGYSPLVDFWSSQGFVVVQPTHLDTRSLNITPDDPRYPDIWRFRVSDLTSILDQLSHIEASVPGLSGRLDHSRIAAIGHSWGGQTASMLLGARILDSDGVPGENMSDPRITVGVLLSTTGKGGKDLSAFAAEHFPFMSPTFEFMTTPALVIAGDHDQSPLTVRGPDWFSDPYFCSPGPKSLVTLFGAEHSLGGVSGFNAAETTDENPERVSLVQELTLVYLQSAFHPEDASWPKQNADSQGVPNSLYRIANK
jgi:Chlorophyllase enzyme